ncbi:MAG: hypothetical protein KA066_00815 [Candidatus Pacebacteria bacterium]|nr:hypothetical protein [Candidatus Paceibacterota bacterium]
MKHKEFSETLLKVYSKETSSIPDKWDKTNPALGHCAIVALAAQDVFGGRILRSSLEGSKDYSYMKSHYWNKLPDGDEVDFTESQFQGDKPEFFEVSERTRQEILATPNTKNRYELLKAKLSN